MIEKIDLYLGMAVAGIFTGLGSAIGSWVANRGILKHIEKIEFKMKRGENAKLSHFSSRISQDNQLNSLKLP